MKLQYSVIIHELDKLHSFAAKIYHDQVIYSYHHVHDAEEQNVYLLMIPLHLNFLMLMMYISIIYITLQLTFIMKQNNIISVN